MFSFILAEADGAWILFAAGTAVQGNCQGLPHPPSPAPSYVKKERNLSLPDQPIHFADEQTETSNST